MRRRAGWIATGLGLTLLVGCAGGAVSTPTGTGSGAAPSPAVATPGGASASPTARESAKPTAAAAEPVPIAGMWRVRKVLAPESRSALIDGATFDDEAFTVTPGCSTEPCPTIEIAMTPLGRAEPVSVAVLSRDGDRYVSAAQAETEGPCLDPFGDRVQGGATVTSTMQLWAATVRPSGSAVETVQLLGSIDLAVQPTTIGAAAGCEAQTATYELTGRRGAVAVRGDPPPEADEPPNTAGGMVALPPIGVEVTGAKISYFAIDGDTVRELAANLARGGVKACGAINYEWNRGDDRPAACAVTSFPGAEGRISERIGAGGACTIRKAAVTARFVIHFPRWKTPERVPAPLLAWWREVVVFIRDHEAGHVRISRDHLKELNAQLTGADCSEADTIIGRWARKLSAAHEAFDRREYALPWPVPPAGY
jgi:predicted secreted Zn-dependent protease